MAARRRRGAGPAVLLAAQPGLPQPGAARCDAAGATRLGRRRALAPFALFLPGWALANTGRPDLAVTLLGGGLAQGTAAFALLWSFDLVFGGSLGEEIGCGASPSSGCSSG